MTSVAVQDYLKAVLALESADDSAQTSQIASRLGVSAASVSQMVRKLTRDGLVEHEPYRGVRLTGAGRRQALDLVRTHRLIETWLHASLSVPLDELHDEAEQLEHAISPKLRKRIADALGNPITDPHGDPIPALGAEEMRAGDEQPLDTCLGTVRVVRVDDRDAAALRHLEAKGILPGAEIEVLEVEPFEGPVWVRVPRRRRRRDAIGRVLARTVFVSEEETDV